MKKTTIILMLALLVPCGAMANVSFNVHTEGISFHIGQQDHRGYYWDGYGWRSPEWWHAHHHRHYVYVHHYPYHHYYHHHYYHHYYHHDGYDRRW